MEQETQQCTAKSKSRGARCNNAAVPGSNVCRIHGGAAPQVKAKAAERLAALVDPAIDRLARLLKSGDDAAAYRAVKDVLDRNGFKPKDAVEVTGKDGGPIQLESNPKLKTLSDDELAAALELARKLAPTNDDDAKEG
jgi:hypothetical protein